MPFSCPKAPDSGPAPIIHTTTLLVGTKLVRFHGSSFAGNSFNPNTGKCWTVAEDGSRFNPFPNARGQNVSHLYAADNFAAAAIESVFHAVQHIPSPDYPRSQLRNWLYSELELLKELRVFELTNPNLRQLTVPGRTTSLVEGELIHTEADQYPNTRTWARYLHSQIADLHGLTWRPRLGGQGSACFFFGDRCRSTEFSIKVGPTPLGSGIGLAQIKAVANAASIRIIDTGA
jgi:RES domain